MDMEKTEKHKNKVDSKVLRKPGKHYRKKMRIYQ